MMTRHEKFVNDDTLIANGYEPVAVAGKAPVAEGWQSGPVTSTRIAADRAAHPEATNTGLRCGRLVGLDIDIRDERHADRVAELAKETLGVTTLARVGSKGVLLAYRNETPVRKITIAGKGAKIEILGTGQQFVAYGIHPDTGNPFCWIGEDGCGLGTPDPLTVSLDMLPVVTPAVLQDFATKAAALLDELGYRPATVSNAGERKPATPSASTGKRLSWEGLRTRLSYIHPQFDGTRPTCYPPQSPNRPALSYGGDAWLAITLVLRDAKVPLLDTDEHDWIELIEEWSCGALWYERTGEQIEVTTFPPEGIEARLGGTKREGGAVTTVATIIEYAADGGCPLPPDDEPKLSAAEIFKHVDLSEYLSASVSDQEPFDLFGDVTLAREPELARDALPNVIADFAFDAAERIGVDPAMVAIPTLAVCAAALPDGFTIQPKVNDTRWTESARLWFAMVAAPGSKKTPAINTATSALREIEGRWQQEDGAKIAQFEAESERYKAKLKGHNDAVKTLGDAADVTPNGTMPEAPIEPTRRRLTIGDATMEALAHILATNERGVLAIHDELVAMIAGFDAYRGNSGIGKDRTAALELWNGGPRTIDRVKAGGSIAVPNWSASVVGGIQPDKLREIAAKLDSDGFLQRFQPFAGRTVGAGVDRAPDEAAIGAYKAVVRTLVNLPPPVPPRAITLSPEAQVYRREVEAVAAAMIVLPTTPSALKGHLAKWPGIYARLLLTLHAIECVADAGPVLVTSLAPTVGVHTARRARDLMLRFFLPHAVEFYREFFQTTDADIKHVRWIAGYILARSRTEITMRELKRAYRHSDADEDVILRTTAALQRMRWVGEAQYPGKGSTRWQVNPHVHVCFAERAASERERREVEHKAITEAKGQLEAMLDTRADGH
jgi:hypothetical protein